MKLNSNIKTTADIVELTSMANEDEIVLNNMAVGQAAGDARRDDCYTHLAIKGIKLTQKESIIDKPRDRHTPFLKLFAIAEQLAGTTSEYVTGLKLNLGIKKDKICVLYQPVGLVRSTFKNKSLLAGQVEYDVVCDTNYYIYDDTNNEFVKDNDTTPLADYKKYIEILHNNNAGTAFSKFIQGTDVESAIFSFQEIFAVLDDNPGTDTVGICNSIDIDPTQPNTCIKHSFLLAPDALQVVFYNVYADLAHLCPPNCIKVTYTIN